MPPPARSPSRTRALFTNAALALALAAAPQASLAAPTPTQAAPTPAAQALTQLAALAGTWRIADKPSSPLRIRFWLTAGGTTLVESWERAGQPHSLTLYHRDGPRLIATHYCPQGNQPRLQLEPGAGPLRFTFKDATDLDAGESHLTSLSFDLSDPAKIVRSEVYQAGSDASPSRLVLVRE